MAEEKYYCLLTEAGAALAAKALAESKKVRLTAIAVGDGGGDVPKPGGTEQALINEVYRREIDSSRIDKDDASIAWLHCVLPTDIGGWWVREFGVFAEALDGAGAPVLYAYGNHAPYYKMLQSGGQATTHEIAIPVQIFAGAAGGGGGAVEIVVPEQGYATHFELEELWAATEAGQAAQDNKIKTLESGHANQQKAIQNLHKGHANQEGRIKKLEAALTQTGYELCEFYYFRNPTVRPGFVPAMGGIITDADTKYPLAWEYLQTENGKKLCTTEQQWQHISTNVWYTLASGEKVSWNGIGGVSWFVLDKSAKTIRLPDLRGLYAEAAGFDGMQPGVTHIDTMRRIWGEERSNTSNHPHALGAITLAYKVNSFMKAGNTDDWGAIYHFDSALVVPVGSKTAPRSWGALACVYLGTK